MAIVGIRGVKQQLGVLAASLPVEYLFLNKVIVYVNAGDFFFSQPLNIEICILFSSQTGSD